jgi:hypothetical protein
VPIHETGYHWFRINDETGYHQFKKYCGCKFTKLGIISSEVLWVLIHETGYHRFRINDETGYHRFRINDETGYHQFRRFAASEKAKDMSRHQSRRVQVKGKSKTGDE